MDLINPLIWGTPIFVALVLIELAYSKTHHHEKLYSWKDLLASSSMGLGTVLLTPVFKVVSAMAIFYGVYELFNPEINGIRMNDA